MRRINPNHISLTKLSSKSNIQIEHYLQNFFFFIGKESLYKIDRHKGYQPSTISLHSKYQTNDLLPIHIANIRIGISFYYAPTPKTTFNLYLYYLQNLTMEESSRVFPFTPMQTISYQMHHHFLLFMTCS